MFAHRSFLFCLLAGSLACTRATPPPDSEGPAAAAKPAAEGARPAGPTVDVEGTVHLEGTAPVLPPVPTNESVSRACGTSIPDRSLEVSPDGGLVDAVVWVDAPAQPAPADTEGGAALPVLSLNQTHCDYAPHVLAGRVGQKLQIVNSDPLVHSIHGAENGRTLFNFAQPITGMRAERALPSTPGVLALRCELHPWMHAAVRVFDHPYYALTDGAGHFQIKGVPEGHHTLTVWQPKLGARALPLDVKAGMGPVTVRWRPGA